MEKHQACCETFWNVIKNDPSMIEKYLKQKGKLYLFSWDNILGKDDGKLRKFLEEDAGLAWAENAEILKSNDGKTIRISKDENQSEIILDETNEKAALTISDGRTIDLKVKKEVGKLNIYRKSNKKEKEIKQKWML